MMIFALWDADAGALTGEYPTEADALAAVYRTVQEDGPDALDGYALLRDDGRHDPALIASGAKLAALALRKHALGARPPFGRQRRAPATR
jgi:hypothetical protein